jgi:aquaporin related protein
MFLTALLMLAILLLAAEKNKATFIAPIGIGLALFVAELLGVYYTGGSLNPARSFGPDVVLRSFATYRMSSSSFLEPPPTPRRGTSAS